MEKTHKAGQTDGNKRKNKENGERNQLTPNNPQRGKNPRKYEWIRSRSFTRLGKTIGHGRIEEG